MESSPPSETRTRFGYTGRGATPDRVQPRTGDRWESRFATVVPPADSTMSPASGALSTPSPMTNQLGALEGDRRAAAAAPVVARHDAGAAEEKGSERPPVRLSFPGAGQSGRRGAGVAASSASGGRRGGRPQSSAAAEAAAAAAASDTDDTEAEKENLRELMRALGGDESANDANDAGRARDERQEGEEEQEQEEERWSAGFPRETDSAPAGAGGFSPDGDSWGTEPEMRHVGAGGVSRDGEGMVGGDTRRGGTDVVAAAGAAAAAIAGEADAGGGDTLLSSLRAQNGDISSRLRDISLQVSYFQYVITPPPPARN